MARYQVILAYDGTDFFGFQRQGQSRTVQLIVEDALREIGWQHETIYAAGRTDTGVHASGQVICFDLEWRHDLDTLIRAINANLPKDVSVSQAEVVEENFHPRFQARFRAYRYLIYSAVERDPVLDRYAWRVYPELSLDKLNQAAVNLVGKHDFASFGKPPKPGGSTIRMIYQALWQKEEGNRIFFDVTGSAFLYHMVRRMVLLQVQVAQERLSLEEFRKIIGEQKVATPGLAPPHGLFLKKVGFTRDVAMMDDYLSNMTFETL